MILGNMLGGKLSEKIGRKILRAPAAFLSSMRN
jgi:hypothetical protein